MKKLCWNKTMVYLWGVYGICNCIGLKAQSTSEPTVDLVNSLARIESIHIDEKDVRVIINVSKYDWIRLSSNTYLSYVNQLSAKTEYVAITSVANCQNNQGVPFDRKLHIDHGLFTSIPYVQLNFHLAQPIPNGTDNISIIENVRKGFVWQGIHIRPVMNNWRSEYNVGGCEVIDSLLEHSNISQTGIYLNVENDYSIAFVSTHENEYKIIKYQKDCGKEKIGDILAELQPTDDYNNYIGILYDYGRKDAERVIIRFEGNTMILKKPQDFTQKAEGDIFIRTRGHKKTDDHISSHHQEWSGTGFALLNGYVVTNYHVIEDAREIIISGYNGDFLHDETAKVVAFDKDADLALLKTENLSIKPNPPYAYATRISDVGEIVFALGYPLTQSMGLEIKLTNGIISSKSGYSGDVANYQISVPVQPGNSGGPLFDLNGNIVGIICAKHSMAENASYAVKSIYLKNLVESVISPSILPHTNKLKGKSFTDQVKEIKDYVYMIKCTK